MAALALELREVLVCPVDTAEACSRTTMVTISPVVRARTSAARSAIVAGEDQSEPGLSAPATTARRCASSMYWSSGDFSDSFLSSFFGPANEMEVHSAAVKTSRPHFFCALTIYPP